MANNYWRDVTLKEVADVNPDSIDKKWPYDHISYIDISSVGQGYISIKPAFISLVDAPSRAKRRVRLGDTVLSTVRPNRRSMFYASDPSPDWIVSTGFAVIRPKQDMISPRYLYSCVFNQTFTDYLVAHEIGAAYPAVSVNDILNAPIHLPPRKEQDAIAGILGALDDKIELNRQLCKTLEDTAQAIFKSWFVDFDPVHAKAAGKQPVGLKPEIAALFPDSFVDSELGKIPKGWIISRLGDHFHLTMGQSPPGNTYNEDGTGDPFYQGRSDFGFRFPRNRVYCTAPKRYAEKGDTLVSVRAPVGDINMAFEHCAIGRGVAAVRHIGGSSIFTYYSMKQLRNNFVSFEAEGSVFGSITKGDFLNLPFIAPSIALIESFDQSFAVLENSIESYELESITLTSIRDSLLPRLISGELKVKDAERIASRLI